ncbi:hypothetical protein BC940DRAFT_307539 [Gongronella butleri]|nr:hypothetical protein BC940DRAFT_307539 [Gongronella butleri]
MEQRQLVAIGAFIASSVAVGYYARIHLFHEILPKVGLMIAAYCQRYADKLVSHEAGNTVLCSLITFFQRAIEDYLGVHVLRILLGLLATIQALVAIEGSRHAYSWYNPVAWFAFWMLLANVMTIAVVGSVAYLPILVLVSATMVARTKQPLSRDERDRPFDDSTVPVMVTPARVYAIFWSILLAYGVPTVLMTTTILTKKTSPLATKINAFWQLSPALVQPLYIVLTWVIRPWMHDARVEGKPGLPNDENRKRQRVRMVQSKSAVERVYLLLGIINLIVYYTSYLQVVWDGIHLKDSLIMLFSAELPSASLTPTQIAQYFCSHFLFMDLLMTTLAFTMWACYQHGALVGLLVLIGDIVLGPGCALSLYLCYREYFLQDTQLLVERAAAGDRKDQ